MAQENTLNIKEEMTVILSKILNRPASELTFDARFVEDLGMDSILSIEILAAIEKKFKITIPDEDIKKVASLRQAIALAERYIAKG